MAGETAGQIKVPARQGQAVARQDGREVRAPGQIATAEETAQAIGDLANAEFSEAAAELMQGIYDAYDPEQDDAPVENALIDGPAADDRLLDRPMPDEDRPGAVRAQIEATLRPRTLQALVGAARHEAGVQIVAAPGNDLVAAPPAAPRWHSVRNLPAATQRPIMAFGRSVFRNFPCFQQLETRRRQAGADALAEVRLLASIGGRGPSTHAEVDEMSNWIRANGTALDAGQVGFGRVMPGYRPNIILAATESESFLLVQETRANGAPADASYVYSWEGGLAPYLANDQRRRVLEGMLADQQPALPAPDEEIMEPIVRLADPVPEPVVARAAAPEAAPARRAAPRRAARAGGNRPTPPRPDAPATRPVGAVAPMAAFRAAGFAPFGSDEGPALRKTLEDGTTALVFGESGRSLALAKKFTVRLLDADGDTIDERPCENHEEALEFVEEPRGSAMRP